MKASGNIQLTLMELPPTITVVEVEANCRCGYCGGLEPANGEKPKYVNGLRIHPKHKLCIKSANLTLFDMSETNFQAKK